MACGLPSDFKDGAFWFSVTKNKTSADLKKLDGNQTMPQADFKDLSERLSLLKLGRTNTGAYAVIIGGIMNDEGKLESHGRWLPFPILVPMMVGTAMSMENGYYSDEASFEIGKLAEQTLLGNFEAKEKIRAFFWAAHQLARKMNLMQMAELTKSCPDLKGVFDLAAMVRMRKSLSVSIGEIKRWLEKSIFCYAERVEARKEKAKLEQEGEIIRKNFESELKIIYAATLLTGNPSGVLRFIESYPVYKKDGDKEAAVAALQDLRTAMFYGKGALDHLLEQNKPIHDDGFLQDAISPVFPLVGGFFLTYFSHEFRDLAILLKIVLIVSSFFFLLLFLSNILPRPSYLRANSHFFLRWTRRLSVSIVWGLFNSGLEPTFCNPRTSFRAGFDGACESARLRQ